MNRSQTVKAIAVDAAGNRSPVASFAYVIRQPSAVSLNLSTATVRLGATKAISGAVAPAHTGSVKVTIKRDGKQVLARNLPLSGSRYSLRYKPNAVGSYSVTVSFAGDADHKPSAATKSFRVIRR